MEKLNENSLNLQIKEENSLKEELNSKVNSTNEPSLNDFLDLEENELIQLEGDSQKRGRFGEVLHLLTFGVFGN